MANFIDVLVTQIKIIIRGIPYHLTEFPISIMFLAFLILVFVLNIIKKNLISSEKKRGDLYQSCKYLVEQRNGQDCSHPSYRKQFRNNENGCSGCQGRVLKMTDIDAEELILNGKKWKRTILLLANCGKSLLPYISFLYTLVVTIFENNK